MSRERRGTAGFARGKAQKPSGDVAGLRRSVEELRARVIHLEQELLRLARDAEKKG